MINKLVQIEVYQYEKEEKLIKKEEKSNNDEVLHLDLTTLNTLCKFIRHKIKLFYGCCRNLKLG